MRHHATATFQDRALVDRAIDGLILASMPHEQMRLVVRDATGEETVSIGPRRPVIPFLLVGIPGATVVAFIGSWGSGAPIPGSARRVRVEGLPPRRATPLRGQEALGHRSPPCSNRPCWGPQRREPRGAYDVPGGGFVLQGSAALVGHRHRGLHGCRRPIHLRGVPLPLQERLPGGGVEDTGAAPTRTSSGRPSAPMATLTRHRWSPRSRARANSG